MILIFGYSKLSAQLIDRLHKEKKKFIIIEPNLQQREFAQNNSFVNEIYDFECFDDDELLSLGIKNNINILFCMHNDFNQNLFVTLSARNLNKNLRIVSSSANNNETKKLKLAGATYTISTYETTALKIFRELHRPMSVKILDDILYKKTSLEIREIKIEENCLLDGKLLNKITSIDKHRLILLGIQDKELSSKFIFSSRGINHKIDVDDIIVVLGNNSDIDLFIQDIYP